MQPSNERQMRHYRTTFALNTELIGSQFAIAIDLCIIYVRSTMKQTGPAGFFVLSHVRPLINAVMNVTLCGQILLNANPIIPIVYSVVCNVPVSMFVFSAIDTSTWWWSESNCWSYLVQLSSRLLLQILLHEFSSKKNNEHEQGDVKYWWHSNSHLHLWSLVRSTSYHTHTHVWIIQFEYTHQRFVYEPYKLYTWCYSSISNHSHCTDRMNAPCTQTKQ